MFFPLHSTLALEKFFLKSYLDGLLHLASHLDHHKFVPVCLCLPCVPIAFNLMAQYCVIRYSWRSRYAPLKTSLHVASTSETQDYKVVFKNSFRLMAFSHSKKLNDIDQWLSANVSRGLSVQPIYFTNIKQSWLDQFFALCKESESRSSTFPLIWLCTNLWYSTEVIFCFRVRHFDWELWPRH